MFLAWSELDLDSLPITLQFCTNIQAMYLLLLVIVAATAAATG